MQPILTISTLESHLWEAANILRGSPLDRADWKSYILPLLFFKRLCDVWDEEYQEALGTYGEDFADLLDCVTGLGPNLFYNSPMEACIVICRVNKPPERRGSVLFI